MIANYDHFMLTKKILKPCQLIATLVKKDVNISEYKYMYFEDPKEIYLQNEQKIWEYFDEALSIDNLKVDLQSSNAIIDNLKADLQSSNAIIDNLKVDLKALISSRSWKITAPLRKIKKIIKKQKTST